MKLSELSAVTALYDTGRQTLDGPDKRTVETYIGWLNATLRAPLPFTIFLDPSIDPSLIAAKPGDLIVQTPLDSFEPAQWRERVEAICEGKKLRSNPGITFRIVTYGLLMFCKFDMISQAAKLRPTDKGMIWVDAGLSRFFEQDLADTKLNARFIDTAFEGAAFAGAITPLLDKALASGRLSQKYVSKCERLFTGGDFFVAASQADYVCRKIYDFVTDEWLANDLWDNEQVAVGYVLLNGIDGWRATDVSLKYAGVFDETLGFPARKQRVRKSLAARLARLLGR